MYDDEPTEANYHEDLTTLLGIALDRLGGHLELTADEVAEVKARYGHPAPILVCRIDGGLLGHISTLENLVDEQWPLMAHAMDCTEDEARAAAAAVKATILARRAMLEAHRARARAHAAARRDGLN